MKKILSVSILGLLLAVTVSAHVTVNPRSVGVAARQVFTISVPNEKDMATTGVRLVLPENIESATPTVKPGWRIEIKNVPTGNKVTDHHGMEVDEMRPTEIVWTGGSIPQGQRDEFTFASRAPAGESKLAWKAYQTYSDGSVVAWDQTPGTDVENPYSVTEVVDDLSADTEEEAVDASTSKKGELALVFSIVALALSVFVLTRRRA
jgi:uncharacterized protein YcnI